MAKSNSSAPTNGGYVLRMRNVAFAYGQGEPLLRVPRFDIKKGRHHFISGSSGSGKSTLLGLITGVLEPSYGTLEVLGNRLEKMSRRARDRFRGARLGYIFQTFNLIPYLTVLENILLPGRLNPRRRAGGSLRDDALKLAERMNITSILHQEASSISVGQAQRTAAARALLGEPELIIADEPTSALDEKHRVEFLEILFSAVEKSGSTVLMVSHDPRIATHFPDCTDMSDLNHANSRATTEKEESGRALARTNA